MQAKWTVALIYAPRSARLIYTPVAPLDLPADRPA